MKKQCNNRKNQERNHQTTETPHNILFRIFKMLFLQKISAYEKKYREMPIIHKYFKSLDAEMTDNDPDYRQSLHYTEFIVSFNNRHPIFFSQKSQTYS